MRDRKNGFPADKEHKPSIRGGLFDSPPWWYSTDDKTKIKRAYTQIWGRVTTEPITGIKNVPYAIAHVSARWGVTVEVSAFGDTQARMALENVHRGDMVFVLGQRERKLVHRKKKDIDEWGKNMVAAFVCRGDAITLLHDIYEASWEIGIGIPKLLVFLWHKFREEAIVYWAKRDMPDKWDGD